MAKKPGFMKRVLELIKNSNIVLEVVDARFADETRNPYLERKVLNHGKKLIIVMNKADLLPKHKLIEQKKKMKKITSTVFLSATNRKGIIKLKELIGKSMKSKQAKIGVIGYPNTGKSSLINALVGRKATRTSRKAGFTRGQQYVRISKNVVITDSPGIIPFDEKFGKSEFKAILVLAKNPEQITDPETVAEQLISKFLEENPKALKKAYNLEVKDKEPYDLIELIAKQKGKLKKGGIPDTKGTSIMILTDYQKHKLAF